MGTIFAVVGSNLTVAYFEEKIFVILPQIYAKHFDDFFIRNYFRFLDDVFINGWYNLIFKIFIKSWMNLIQIYKLFLNNLPKT